MTNHVILIENVAEYSEEITRKYLGPSWACASVCIDPRNFGVPASRTRLYILAWRRDKVQWTLEGTSLQDIMACLGAKPVGGAGDFWFMNLPKSKLSEAQAL